MTLLKAERRECVKTLALSSRIDAEYQRLASEGPQQREPTPRAAIQLTAATGSALDAYQRHSQDVLQRQQGGKVDFIQSGCHGRRADACDRPQPGRH